jgi:hypothetical protein
MLFLDFLIFFRAETIGDHCVTINYDRHAILTTMVLVATLCQFDYLNGINYNYISETHSLNIQPIHIIN